jgi:hypothetical protein
LKAITEQDYLAFKMKVAIVALAAWRGGHRIRLTNRRPGFESRHGTYKVVSANIAMLFVINLHALFVRKSEK